MKADFFSVTASSELTEELWGVVGLYESLRDALPLVEIWSRGTVNKLVDWLVFRPKCARN